MALTLIGVIGGGTCDRSIRDMAYETGTLIARKGYGLVCGGLGGVMEAAAEGCAAYGGLTVGIIPQETMQSANPYVQIVIPTGMGIMRNLLIVRSAKGLIAVNGQYGTLSEMAFALQMNKPIVGIKSWDLLPAEDQFSDPQRAFDRLMEKL